MWKQKVVRDPTIFLLSFFGHGVSIYLIFSTFPFCCLEPIPQKPFRLVSINQITNKIVPQILRTFLKIYTIVVCYKTCNNTRVVFERFAPHRDPFSSMWYQRQVKKRDLDLNYDQPVSPHSLNY